VTDQKTNQSSKSPYHLVKSVRFFFLTLNFQNTTDNKILIKMFSYQNMTPTKYRSSTHIKHIKTPDQTRLLIGIPTS
jgi:hypothetical protein